MSREVWNLLEEFDKLENIIRSNMMPDEREIIEGINIVREIVKELNPDKVDSEFRDNVKFISDKYEKSKNSQMKVMNAYTKYGISRCISIIEAMITLWRHEENNKVIKVRRG